MRSILISLAILSAWLAGPSVADAGPIRRVFGCCPCNVNAGCVGVGFYRNDCCRPVVGTVADCRVYRTYGCYLLPGFTNHVAPEAQAKEVPQPMPTCTGPNCRRPDCR